MLRYSNKSILDHNFRTNYCMVEYRGFTVLPNGKPLIMLRRMTKSELKTLHLHSELPSLFQPVWKLEMLFTCTVIPSQLLGVVLHSTPGASFQHPLSVGMIFLVELWTAWSFRNSKLVLISFYWTDILTFSSSSYVFSYFLFFFI